MAPPAPTRPCKLQILHDPVAPQAVDPTDFVTLSSQVQQLSASQMASQQQMQQLYAGQQTVQQQIHQLLGHLQGSVRQQAQPQSAMQLLQAPPVQQPSSTSTSQTGPAIPMGPPCGPTVQREATGAPAMAVHPGRSLALYFPDVRPALLLAISKHDFDPGHLFKLDPQMKDRPKDSALQLSDTGILIRAERNASPKEYPSFRSLHDPLHIYFSVITHQLIMSSNMSALINFTQGSSKYMSSLYKLYLDYEWPQGLEYHFKFHNHCMVEMQEGHYGGWEHVDGGLMSIHLYGNPRTCPAKENTASA